MLLAAEVLLIVLCVVSIVAVIGYSINRSAAAEASPRHKDKSA